VGKRWGRLVFNNQKNAFPHFIYGKPFPGEMDCKVHEMLAFQDRSGHRRNPRNA